MGDIWAKHTFQCRFDDEQVPTLDNADWPPLLSLEIALGWEICQTPSDKFEARVRLPAGLLESGGKTPQPESGALAIVQTPSAEFDQRLFAAFPLAWSHYVRLMAVGKPHARAFYEAEAIRGGWSVRQLDRQIATQFFERPSSAKQQAALLARGRKPRPADAVSADEEVRDPYSRPNCRMSKPCGKKSKRPGGHCWTTGNSIHLQIQGEGAVRAGPARPLHVVLPVSHPLLTNAAWQRRR